MRKVLNEVINLKVKKSITVLSLIYSLLIIFGTSYMKCETSSLVFKYFYISIPCLIILFMIFRLLIILLFNFLDNYKTKDKSKNKFINLLNKHPFIISIVVILIMWMPYIISFYPAIFSPDPSFQIKQYFGIPNKYSDYSILLDENVIITNHHPVFIHLYLCFHFIL